MCLRSLKGFNRRTQLLLVFVYLPKKTPGNDPFYAMMPIFCTIHRSSHRNCFCVRGDGRGEDLHNVGTGTNFMARWSCQRRQRATDGRLIT